MLKGSEVGEVCDPPIDGPESDNFDHPRLRRTRDAQEWRTDYPPSPGFAGHEEGEWKDDDYCRTLSDDELAALVAAGIAEPSGPSIVVTVEEDEAERDAFFSRLAARAGDDDPA